jgi:hypothetical protein
VNWIFCVVTPLYVLYFNINFLEKGGKDGEKKWGKIVA